MEQPIEPRKKENCGIVETCPRSGTPVLNPRKLSVDRLTFAEIAEATSSEVLAAQEGLEREFSVFNC